MKKSNGILLTALAIGAAVIYSKSRKFHPQGLLGIGVIRPKRRIWNEIEDAQKAGIDLTDKSAWEKHAPLLRRMASGKIKEDGATPMEQRYFNQLSRAYKSIAGTNLPYKESVVRNENDDVILIYRDYDLAHIANKAAEWCRASAKEDLLNPYGYGYWATVSAIASGKKFIWKSKGVHRGIEQLVFGASSPEERKQRISYLGSESKAGEYGYPEMWAHLLWENNDRQQDDQEITNGVLDAFREINSVGTARKACTDAYLKAHQIEEPLLYQDVPF